MSYIDLESVGSTLTSDLLVFPIDISEPPVTASDTDEMMGVHLYDIDDEWFNSLSSEDLTDFFEFVENTLKKGFLIVSVYNDWKENIWSNWEDANNCYMNLELI